MLNPEETANIVTLIEDLKTDVGNGNIPAAKLLIISLVNYLTLKQPLEWQMLGSFISDHLDEKETKAGLLHLLRKINLVPDPSLPGGEAGYEC